MPLLHVFASPGVKLLSPLHSWRCPPAPELHQGLVPPTHSDGSQYSQQQRRLWTVIETLPFWDEKEKLADRLLVGARKQSSVSSWGVQSFCSIFGLYCELWALEAGSHWAKSVTVKIPPISFQLLRYVRSSISGFLRWLQLQMFSIVTIT